MDQLRRFPIPVAAMAALIAGLLALASADADHLSAPSIVGQRAIVVDTLTDDVLFGKAPDSKALQGSIAKIVTAHVALWAANEGYVSLNDEVVISPKAEGQACTCMPNADNGQGVQVGETFLLQGLLYGVLIRSAGEPTNAVAEYVASKVYNLPEPTATTDPADSEAAMNLFLGLMNDHVADLGLDNSRFVTVHGGDVCDFDIGCNPECHPGDCALTECSKGELCDGGTTPRDLLALWRHAAEDHPFFLTVAGARDVIIPSAFNGQLKIYQLSQGFAYHPGIEGDKGGNSAGSGNNLISQSTRLGRTLIAAVMQAGTFPPGTNDPANDTDAMYDFGFASILHPELRGSSDPWGIVEDHALECLSDTRAVSAIITPDKKLELVTWRIDVEAGLVEELVGRIPPARRDQPSGFAMRKENKPSFASEFKPTEVDVTHMGSGIVVVALRRGAGVDLMTWGIAANGPPFIINGGVPAGQGTSARIERLTDELLVSSLRKPNGRLELKTWRISPDGQTIQHLDTGDVTPQAEEFDLTAQPWFLQGQVLTARRDPSDGNLRLDSWVVNLQGPQPGGLQYLETENVGVPATKIRLSPVTVSNTLDALYAVAYRTNSGILKVRLWSADTSGALSASGDTDTAGELVPASGEILVVPTRQAGIVTATWSGSLAHLTSWDVSRDNPLDGFNVGEKVVSNDSHVAGDLLGLCRVPGADAEADLLLAHEGFFQASLTVDAWRSGERP